MRSFDNLLTRYGFITEANKSPFENAPGTHPSFGGITKSMSERGMSSPPYDTVKFLATFLSELDIISDDEHDMILKPYGTKAKKLALLEVIKAKSQEILANSARIEEEMPTELENYINRSILNRGRDMMADVKGVEGGSGGRRDKYAAQAAERAAKRKASAEAKMQSKALQAAAQGEDADVQSAVDVLINTLDDADREVVDRADVAAGIGFKGAEDVELDFDDIDINIGATVRDRDTLIDKLVKFFNKQPNYTAEKIRRGVNVEGPTGSFGTNVQDAEDMIISLIKRARPDIDETQIVVDLFSDKGVTEDEEDYGEEDYEDENYDPEEEALERRRRAREGGNYNLYPKGGEPPSSYPWNDEGGDNNDADYSDEEVTCSECGKILDSSEYHKEELPEVRLCDKCASIEGGDNNDAAICSVCKRPMSDDEIGDELPEERVCDQCAGIEDEDNEEYNRRKADLDGDGKVKPWERGIARKRGFKNVPEDEEGCNCDEETPYMESYTALYLEGMTRRSHKQVSAPQTVTFKERMKPKTWRQLAELRNYGM